MGNCVRPPAWGLPASVWSWKSWLVLRRLWAPLRQSWTILWAPFSPCVAGRGRSRRLNPGMSCFTFALTTLWKQTFSLSSTTSMLSEVWFCCRREKHQNSGTSNWDLWNLKAFFFQSTLSSLSPFISHRLWVIVVWGAGGSVCVGGGSVNPGWRVLQGSLPVDGSRWQTVWLQRQQVDCCCCCCFTGRVLFLHLSESNLKMGADDPNPAGSPRPARRWSPFNSIKVCPRITSISCSSHFNAALGDSTKMVFQTYAGLFSFFSLWCRKSTVKVAEHKCYWGETLLSTD